MKQLLVFSLFLSLSIQAAWTVKPAANPKAPGQGLAIAEDGKPVAHFVFGEGQKKPFLHVYGAKGELLTNPGVGLTVRTQADTRIIAAFTSAGA